MNKFPIRRRDILAVIGGAAFAAIGSESQAEVTGRPLVGLVTIFSGTEMAPLANAFRARMLELGWLDGRDIAISVRAAEGDYQRLERDAMELIDAEASVVVAMGTPGLAAVMRHTKTVPVVFTVVADPVGQHLIKSLARPGGHITGLTNFEFSIGGKWIELLRELDPKISEVTLITNPANPNTAAFVEVIRQAGAALGLAVRQESVTNAEDIKRAIVRASQETSGALIVFPDGLPIVHRALIIKLAQHQKLPAIYPFRLFPANGGLISYGVDFADVYRQAAGFTDKILRGANPADLPVQAPNKFELVINSKAAKELGLTVPNSLIAAADEVIE